ncbi:hypothetical protein [Xanthobacter tagetidis]|uniref:DUF2946 domain-containing protein n=1 Tax=Xanthobacter tagetidis TaxID=60216 RepID=A0A3L7A4U1_9HYPH|nr:hypothetical protein [Xanthobacter tagetidis]MBB6310010.1 hypothetical protein [Xanthobacter tagetidis]RLP75114.1 hypothetical protein D9R14_17190 [Xanthobacter tagetidis]
MNGFPQARRLCFALAAAYLLALQMLVSGFVLGVQAAPAPSGLADGLCTAAGDRDDDRPAGSLPARFDCCTQGCSMLGGLGLPAQLSADVSPQPFARSATSHVRVARWPGAGVRREPRTARGPPSV